MKNQKGFSLIELLIVVAIILIIAAIAIPSLLRAKIAANESAMTGDMRTVISAEATFMSVANAFTDITALASPNTAYTGAGTVAMLDPVLSAAAAITKQGYGRTFAGLGAIAATATLPGPAWADFIYEGIPVTPGRTGIRSFCAASDGVICFDPTGAAICGGALPAACTALGS